VRFRYFRVFRHLSSRFFYRLTQCHWSEATIQRKTIWQ
jgi:hypothetical protein